MSLLTFSKHHKADLNEFGKERVNTQAGTFSLCFFFRPDLSRNFHLPCFLLQKNRVENWSVSGPLYSQLIASPNQLIASPNQLIVAWSNQL
jgi:hypothetical protein